MTIRTMIIASPFMLLLAEPVFADDDPLTERFPHIYGSFAGGAAWLSEMHFVVDVPTIDERPILDSDTGWATLGAFGYDFGNGLHTELEVGYRRNDGQLRAGFDDGLNLSDSNTGVLDVMANVLYGFGKDLPLQPYVGAGAGIARLNIDLDDGEEIREDDGWAFAYQLIAGLNCSLPDTNSSAAGSASLAR